MEDVEELLSTADEMLTGRGRRCRARRGDGGFLGGNGEEYYQVVPVVAEN